MVGTLFCGRSEYTTIIVSDIASDIAKQYEVPIRFVPWPERYLKVDGGSVVSDSTRFDDEFFMEYSKIV